MLSLRQRTKITTQELARQAGVTLTEAYVVEIGGFADRMIAEKVIRAFSQLSGTVAQRSQLSDLPTTKQAAIPRRKR